MCNNVELPCSDGSDRNCWGRIEPQSYPWQWQYLDNEQKVEVAELARNIREHGNEQTIELTIPMAQACEILKHDGGYSVREIEEIRKSNSTYTIYLIFEAETCSACGSDETYDSEGNNITAL